jgi:uncharacterized protein YbbC (DUF1343 family)
MKHILAKIKIIVLTTSVVLFSCQGENKSPQAAIDSEEPKNTLQVGAERTDLYYPKIQGKNLALMVNQTSVVDDQHLVDRLLADGMQIKRIFAPEHGFRGTADAGEKISDSKDPATGIEIVSLYGKKRKPVPEDLADIDLVILDIQDVGARFYTYISSMHYLMEGLAEQNIPMLVLDRPNPNGHYVDGPVREPELASFVGLHPIPVVHGMTMGEYARMINGEGWLSDGGSCTLEVIPCAGYTHRTAYEVPIKPSPNLPNNRAIYLYPSICYFEGTVFNLGRGTDKQFQVIGAPAPMSGDYSYTPQSMPGAKHPKHEGEVCYGLDLSDLDPEAIRQEARLNLSYLIELYQAYPDKENFFLDNNFFDKLAGTYALREQLQEGWTESQIRETWSEGLQAFKETRGKYLLYDF